MFDSPQKVGHKRVLLFTNDDHPHDKNVAFQRQAKQKAKDLDDIGIEILLMHMALPDSPFRFAEFYQVHYEREREDGRERRRKKKRERGTDRQRCRNKRWREEERERGSVGE